MFFADKKLSQNLKDRLSNKKLSEVRVIIYCDKLLNVVEKSIIKAKGQVVNTEDNLGFITAYINRRAIDRLTELPMVKFISLDCEAHLIAEWNNNTTSNNPYKNLPDANSSVTIALIDSGVYPHNDLTSPNNKILRFIDLINQLEKPYDDNGHGTFISGLICGSGGKTVKYKGLIPSANLFMIKAFNRYGKAYVSDILKSISLVINHGSEYNIKVLCITFECNIYEKRLRDLVKKAFKLCEAKNIAVIVPLHSSISDADTVNGLAYLDHCISVGGREPFKEITYHQLNTLYNAKENKPEFIAPCNKLVSLNHDKDYYPISENLQKQPKLKKSYISLTSLSCAAAYMSAIFAFVYSFHQDFSPKDIISLLNLSTIKVEEDGIFKSKYVDVKLLLENINNMDKNTKKLKKTTEADE